MGDDDCDELDRVDALSGGDNYCSAADPCCQQRMWVKDYQVLCYFLKLGI